MNCLADMPRGAGKNTVPVNYAIAQAFMNMYRWVDDGVPPPRTPFISTRPDGTPELDRNGTAVGGLRLPALMVPAATYGTGRGTCFLLGYQVPFTASKMKALYGTHREYVQDVERAAREDVERRLLSAKAAKAIIARARSLRDF